MDVADGNGVLEIAWVVWSLTLTNPHVYSL